jgi:hypothetical protein
LKTITKDAAAALKAVADLDPLCTFDSPSREETFTGYCRRMLAKEHRLHWTEIYQGWMNRRPNDKLRNPRSSWNGIRSELGIIIPEDVRPKLSALKIDSAAYVELYRKVVEKHEKVFVTSKEDQLLVEQVVSIWKSFGAAWPSQKSFLHELGISVTTWNRWDRKKFGMIRMSTKDAIKNWLSSDKVVNIISGKAVAPKPVNPTKHNQSQPPNELEIMLINTLLAVWKARRSKYSSRQQFLNEVGINKWTFSNWVNKGPRPMYPATHDIVKKWLATSKVQAWIAELPNDKKISDAEPSVVKPKPEPKAEPKKEAAIVSEQTPVSDQFDSISESADSKPDEIGQMKKTVVPPGLVQIYRQLLPYMAEGAFGSVMFTIDGKIIVEEIAVRMEDG